MQTEATIKHVFIPRRNQQAVENYKQDLEIDDHLITIDALKVRFNTDLKNGITMERAHQLYLRNGPNIVDPNGKYVMVKIFIKHMFYNFAALLWIGLLLSLTDFTISCQINPEEPNYDQVYLAVVLLIVILVTGLYGFYQEALHYSIQKTCRSVLPAYTNVIRGGNFMRIRTNEVVVGDLVSLQTGDCVPADIRIIESMDLTVDGSAITGDSEPQLKDSELSDLDPLKTRNTAFMGTAVVDGSGMAIVFATGNNTCMGRITALTGGFNTIESSIQKDVARFIRIITIVGLIIGLTFFIIAICLQYDSFNPMLIWIAISLVILPEGLLVTLTAALTLTAKRMYKNNLLCKNLNAIENLGCISVLCVDKAKILTKNQMSVSHIYYDDLIVNPYESSFSQGFYTLCLVGILCSRADLIPSVSMMSDKFSNADEKDKAIYKYLEIVTGRQATSIKREHTQIFEIPFDLTFQYQVSIHSIPDKSRMYLVMKGSPELVLEYCKWINTKETVEVLTDENKLKLKHILQELSYSGEIIIGFADRVLPEDYTENFEFQKDPLNFPINDLRFVGLISVVESPSKGVKHYIAKCQQSGIKIIMITDDSPVIAMALAKKIGIIESEAVTVFDIAMQRQISVSKVTEQEAASCRAAVIDASENDMNETDLDEAISHYDQIIFAKTMPEQKRQIVEAYQRAGYIVGVTITDVRGLAVMKQADIGIALGVTSDDVTREVADIIIVDDNLESIVIGIEEGRLIHDNIKKSIIYVLSSKCPEVAPFLLHVTCNIPMPICVIGIIIIDLADLWPSISIVYERPEADVMYLPPRNAMTKRLVSMRMVYFANLIIGVLQTLAGLSCWFFAMAEYGFLPDRIIGIREEWYSSNNDVRDSYNQSWSNEERRRLEMKGYSAYFLGVVVTQLADCIIVKTRRQSILRQGMANAVMNFGLLFEIFLAVLIVFCPYVNDFFSFSTVHIYILVPAIPFALCIVFFDELRKGLIRNRPGGWFARETYV